MAKHAYPTPVPASRARVSWPLAWLTADEAKAARNS